MVDYGEDLFQRIVGVHWRKPVPVAGEGVFVAGDYDSNIHYLKVGQGVNPVWQNLGTLGFYQNDGDNFTGFVQGSSCAVVERGGEKTPVFVLVGGQDIGIIMASSDGLSWSRVYTQTSANGPVSADRATGANIFGVVWDENAKSFYAGAHQSFNRLELNVDPNLYECDILLQSSDGFSWSEAERVDYPYNASIPGGGGGWDNVTTGLLAKHCSTRVVDGDNNGLPDGFYKYDSATKTMIVPTNLPHIDYLNGEVSLSGVGATTVIVTRFDVDPNPLPPSNTGIQTMAVAGVGNSWLAGGGTFGTGGGGEGGGVCQASYLAPSIEEGGIRWLPLNPNGSNPIITMVGGEAKKPPI